MRKNFESPGLKRIGDVLVETGCDFVYEDSLHTPNSSQGVGDVPFPWRIPSNKFKRPPVNKAVNGAIYRPN